MHCHNAGFDRGDALSNYGFGVLSLQCGLLVYVAAVFGGFIKPVKFNNSDQGVLR